MIEPQIWAVVLLVPAAVAALIVALGRRLFPAICGELGFSAGFVSGFLAYRALRAVAAASGGSSPDSVQLLELVREQAARLWWPRAVGDWLPLLAGAICLLACWPGTARSDVLRRLAWLGQSFVLAGCLVLQYRKTRHVAMPSAESTALLMQAGTMALVGWLALTWRRWPIEDVLAQPDCRKASRLKRMGVRGGIGVMSGAVLTGLLGLSGSLTLGVESLLVPAALAGSVLGAMGTPHPTTHAGSPFFPAATWSALSISYLVQGALLAQLSLVCGWLWMGSAAIGLGGWCSPRSPAFRLRSSIPALVAVGLFALAMSLAVRQFWLDTH